MKIGCHLSAAKGYVHMLEDALKIDANTFSFFTRNPRGGAAKPLNLNDIASYEERSLRLGFAPVVAHSPYTLNPSSADESVRKFAKRIFKEDLKILEHIPGNFYNFHPGSHVKQGVEIGVNMIAELLNESLFPEQSTVVLLETMAGKGSEIGRNFQEIRDIINRVDLPDKLGVCLDTCHVYDGGYDIVNDLDGVLVEFNDIIGLDKLKAVHLNDSLHGLGSRKDRHAKIGEGKIGLEAILRIINHPYLRELPFILETPNDLAGYAEEIKILRAGYKA